MLMHSSTYCSPALDKTKAMLALKLKGIIKELEFSVSILDQISLNIACRRIKYWAIFSIGAIVCNNWIRPVIKDIQITGFNILIVDLFSIQCLPFDKRNNIENLLAFSRPGDAINRHNKLQITVVVGDSLHFGWTKYMSWPEFFNIQVSLCPFVPFSSLMRFAWCILIQLQYSSLRFPMLELITGIYLEFKFSLITCMQFLIPSHHSRTIRFALSGKAPSSHLIQITQGDRPTHNFTHNYE